jgi:RHS repeat-associated protein
MTATYNTANEPTLVNKAKQTYDAAGHLTNDGTNSYTWNDRGQLVSVTGTGLNESYGYSPAGLRTQVTSGGSTTSYLWDLSGNQVAELTSGTVKATELTGLGADRTPIRTDANGSRSQLTDRLGSTVATTDATGVVKSQFGYTPYGQQAASGESIPGAPAFTGRTTSSVTGLQYNRDRYYNPTLGRFISQDPTGQAGGLNTYAYVDDDPVNATDPSGDGPDHGTCNPPRPGTAEPPKPGVPWTPRRPDYYNFNFGYNFPWGSGVGYNIAVTNHGKVYAGPEFGRGMPGVSGSVRAGWIDQWAPPSQSQINSFVSGLSMTASLYVPVADGIGPSVAKTWGKEGSLAGGATSTEVGIGAGQGDNASITQGDNGC